jgi:hypothetical protein
MVDTDTFLTALYVMTDDFLKAHGSFAPRPGPKSSLSPSEIVTLAAFAQWRRFASERDFYRWADRHLRPAFPALPDRTQFNRLARAHTPVMTRFALWLVDDLGARRCLYEAIDGTAMPVRDAKRRGNGWLAGQANIGWSNRLGWYEGFHVLTCVTPIGVITGFGVAPASTNERPYTETLLAARCDRPPRLECVGKAALGPYVTDKGFASNPLEAHWRAEYGADVLAPPQKTRSASTPQKWPPAWRRFASSVRQIVETVNDKLHNCFRLGADRPHDLTGVLSRVSAKVALHNFCIWLNHRLGRPPLAFADLVDW